MDWVSRIAVDRDSHEDWLKTLSAIETAFVGARVQLRTSDGTRCRGPTRLFLSVLIKGLVELEYFLWSHGWVQERIVTLMSQRATVRYISTPP